MAEQRLFPQVSKGRWERISHLSPLCHKAPRTSEGQAFLLSLPFQGLELLGERPGERPETDALVSHFVTLQNLNKSWRQGAVRELAQEWSWPQGRETEELAGLRLSHLLILFLKPT